MTNLTSYIFIFFLTLYGIKCLKCTSPMKCVCIRTKPHIEIECHHVGVTWCDKKSLDDLLRFRRAEEVTLVNCAEKIYFPDLIKRLDSTHSVRLHHLAQENPPLDAIPGNMRKLELKHYTLRTNTFDDLPELNEITIMFSNIKVRNPFHRLWNLRKLDLSFNGIINKLEASGSLLVKYNVEMQFNILEEDIFEPLGNLVRLNLSHNSLWIVEEEVLRHLVNLEEIDFSYNFIQAVETNAFATNVKLRVLSLRNNRIKFNEAYGPMVYPRSLELLDLRKNNLSYFFAEWMKPAFTLDLSDNNINVLDLRLLQNALWQNMTYYLKETSDFNGTKLNSSVLLGGNPVSLNSDLQNLVSFFDVVKGDATLRAEFDLPNLECVKTERYLCSLGENRKSFCPRKCACSLAPWEFAFIVNCTRRTENEVPTLRIPNFFKVEAYLEGNSLKSGPGKNMGYDSVSELYLSGNDIEVIGWIPEKLQVFEIHDNNLGLLDMNIIEALNRSKSTTRITLHDNPWRCRCDSSKFIRAMQSLIHHKKINARSIKCEGNDALLINLTESDLCPTNLKSVLILSACLTALGLFSSALVILYYKFGHDLKVYLFAKKLFLPCVTRREPYADRKYDAFVCYTFRDENFVCEHLLPVLEGGPNPYRLCIHVRNWIAGELITQQMIWSIEHSKRTVVVMSPDYLESNWAMMELRLAYDRVVEGNAEIIIVSYRDIDVQGLEDEDLKQYLKRSRFVKWKKPRFWDKLKYALPHY